MDPLNQGSQQQGSSIQFNEQADEFGRPPVAPQGSDFTGKLIAWGVASNRQQAEYIMVGLVVVILAIAFFTYRAGTADVAPPPQAPTAMNE